MRRRESDREIFRSVWDKVKTLEKLDEEADLSSIYRALEGDEDPEVRQAVKALYEVGLLAYFHEWDENQP